MLLQFCTTSYSYLLVSRGHTFTSRPLSLMLLQLFQASQCFHAVALMHHMLGSSLLPVFFDAWSFAPLSCNPYLVLRLF